MPKITFLKTGDTAEVEPGTSFLDYCQSNDAPHRFGCTVGSCGTCILEITEGSENVQPAEDEERETVEQFTDHSTARLGCQLIVNGDISIKALDD